MTRPVCITLVAAAAMAVFSIWWAPADQGRAAVGPEVVSSRESAIPRVRVLLENEDPTCNVRVEGPYRVTTRNGWTVLAQGDKLPSVEVTIHAEGLRIGSKPFAAYQLTLEIIEDGSLWVGEHCYRGDLNLERKPDGTVLAINVVDVEAYLASVLPSEMPSNFPLAAQQAQTIAARTYTIHKMKTAPSGKPYDLANTHRDQVYLGKEYLSPQPTPRQATNDALVSDEPARPRLAPDRSAKRLAVESASSRQVTEQTRGMVAVYRGRPFMTYYSAVCGGHTGQGQSVFDNPAPPLIGVPCSYCQSAPNYQWRRTVDRSDVETKLANYLRRQGTSIGPIDSIAVDDPGQGILPQLRIRGHQGEHLLSAVNFRLHVLGADVVPSPYFRIAFEGESVVVEGRGWGHGVGLCQWGAREQAEQGRACLEILSYYYPGSKVVVVK